MKYRIGSSLRIEKLNVGRSLCLFRAVIAKGKAGDAFKNDAFFFKVNVEAHAG